MSTVHAAGIDDAINNGLPPEVANVDVEWGISTTADDTMTGITNTVTTVGNNPETTTPSNLYTPVSGVLQAEPSPTWEADIDGDSVEQFKLRVDVGQNGSFVDLGTWNSSADFGFTTETGGDITVRDFDIDCVRQGIAEAIMNGAGNLNANVHLTDGADNRIGGWATLDPSQSVNASDAGISFPNDITFNNNSGSDQTVGGIEADWAGSDNIFIDATFSDVTVPDGGEIVFTTLEVNFGSLD